MLFKYKAILQTHKHIIPVNPNYFTTLKHSLLYLQQQQSPTPKQTPHNNIPIITPTPLSTSTLTLTPTLTIYPNIINKSINPRLSTLIRYSMCNQQPKRNQQKIDKQKQEQKKMRREQERLTRIQERQKQEIKELNDRVNLTKGKYSPFMAYLKIHKGLIFGLALLTSFISVLAKLMMVAGIYNVEQFQNQDYKIDFTNRKVLNKKKLAIVSQKYQQQNISQYVSSIFAQIYPKVESLTPGQAKKVSNLTASLSNFFSTQNFELVVINSQQPVVLSLPNNKILVSKSLLRTQQLTQPQLEYLLTLIHQSFRQGYHIRTLSPAQLKPFLTKDAQSDIKLRQIYSRALKKRQIYQCIQLTCAKKKISKQSEQYKKMLKMFEKIKKIHDDGHKVGTKVFPQNVYLRLYKYYVMVKVE